MSSLLSKRKYFVGLIVAAVTLTLCSRIAVAYFLSNDTAGDSIVYAQFARNILEQHTFSIDSVPPFAPTYIRLPGYPLFLASIYAIFGHNNNTAVHIVQSVIDTGSCILIALIAWNWVSDERKRFRAAANAFALAALCPFMVIYTAIVLTETCTIFLMCAMTLTATYALKSNSAKRRLLLWIVTGLISGITVTFRPDAGIFTGAIGLTAIVVYLFSRSEEKFVRKFQTAVIAGALLSVSFAAVLVPWTIRNYRLFHVFQPLAPQHANLPGEFVPLGYLAWVRTWLDDERYIDPFIWELGQWKLNVDEVPDNAFDSEEQKQRVSALFDKYNHPASAAGENAEAGNNDKSDTTDQGQAKSDESTDSQEKDENNNSAGNDNAAGDDNSSESDESDDQGDDQDESSDSEDEKPAIVEMTPEIDAQFAEIAKERVRHNRLHYYLLLPMKRAANMWFDNHSQFYPFEGEVFPTSDMDHTTHQHIWLPLFTLLTWFYTIAGALGIWWLVKSPGGWRWAMLALLMVLPRLAFFSTMENPEPRYIVESFAFLAILGGIGFALAIGRRDSEDADTEI